MVSEMEVVKEFVGVRLLRDPKTLKARIVTISTPRPKLKEPEITITAEMRERAEAALHLHCMLKYAGTRAAASTPETPKPEPKPVLSFEEKLEHDWRYSPAIRKEFFTFEAYQAYVKAKKAGRISVCGRS